MLAEGGVDLSLVGVADGETELRVLSATSVKFTGLPKHQAKPNLSRHRSRRGAGWKKQNQTWEEVKRGKQGGKNGGNVLHTCRKMS